MAEVFRQKATALQAGLEDEGQRGSARQALRGFNDAIVIPPEGLLQVVGIVGCGGVQPAVLAAVGGAA